MADMKIDYDLQLFGDEGGEVDGSGAEAAAADSGSGEQDALAGAAPSEENQESKDAGGAEKPGTILGGKEDQTAWDFRSVVPEGMAYDEASASAYAAIAKEAGLTGAQAQKIAAYGMKYAQEGIAAMTRALAEERNGWATAARTELGANFDATVQAAGTGIEAVEKVCPGLRQALNETGAGNRIELIRAFAMIGNLVGEDNFRGFGAAAENKSVRYPNTNFSDY